jgi:hypothetical protein
MCGFAPSDVRAMTLAEASAIIEGFSEFNGGEKKDPPLTRDEYHKLKLECAGL